MAIMCHSLTRFAIHGTARRMAMMDTEKQLNTRPIADAERPRWAPCSGTKKNSMSQPTGPSEATINAPSTAGILSSSTRLFFAAAWRHACAGSSFPPTVIMAVRPMATMLSARKALRWPM